MFKTPPNPEISKKIVLLLVHARIADQDHPDGYKIYPFLESLDLDFFVHAGDIVYYDNLAKKQGNGPLSLG